MSLDDKFKAAEAERAQEQTEAAAPPAAAEAEAEVAAEAEAEAAAEAASDLPARSRGLLGTLLRMEMEARGREAGGGLPPSLPLPRSLTPYP